jgi:hypothetical protein
MTVPFESTQEMITESLPRHQKELQFQNAPCPAEPSRTLQKRLLDLPLWKNPAISTSDKIQLLIKQALQSLYDGALPSIDLPHTPQASAQASSQASTQADQQADRLTRSLRIDPEKRKDTDRFFRLIQLMDSVHVWVQEFTATLFWMGRRFPVVPNLGVIVIVWLQQRAQRGQTRNDNTIQAINR